MKIKELLNESTQSLNQLDDPKVYQKCLDSWRNYYDYEDRTLSEIEDYKYVVDRLIQKGGKVYRVIFADSPEEIRMDDLGIHWTIDESNIDAYIDSLWTNYGKGKKNSYVVVAEVGPNNITNRGVDVAGNPEEKEVNIIRPNEATYQAFEYTNKGRRQRVRENIRESVQSLNQLDDPETYQRCFKQWINFYGSEEKVRDELDEYKEDVDYLIQKGGKIYRVIFADSPEEIRMDDLGLHWTTNEYNMDYYLDSLWTHYGKGKKNAYIAVATVGPNNITNQHVDVFGCPEEKEINIIRPNEATYELYSYENNRRGKRLRENMDHSKDDQAVPQLKAALLAQKKKIQSVKDDKDAVYDIIDGMMTSIAKAHSISGQKLHDMWTKKYKEIPDTWVMHQ
jgi:hypothetical protein